MLNFRRPTSASPCPRAISGCGTDHNRSLCPWALYLLAAALKQELRWLFYVFPRVPQGGSTPVVSVMIYTLLTSFLFLYHLPRFLPSSEELHDFIGILEMSASAGFLSCRHLRSLCSINVDSGPSEWAPSSEEPEWIFCSASPSPPRRITMPTSLKRPSEF